MALIVLIFATSYISPLITIVLYAILFVFFCKGLGEAKDVHPRLNYKICSIFVLIFLAVSELGETPALIAYGIYSLVLISCFFADLSTGEQALPLLSKYLLLEFAAPLFAPILILMLIGQILSLLFIPISGKDFLEALFIVSFFCD